MSTADPLVRQVYSILSDREFHSGTTVAQRCGVSRSAVWKSVAALRGLGVSVHAVANRGYRLPAANELLQAEHVRQRLTPQLAAAVRDGRCLWSTGSTNADLLRRPAPTPGQFDFLTAEFQSAGRGRRARSWFAPPGGAVCLSLSWSFASLPAAIGALSLAIGVCALRALKRIGVAAPQLKWPNDLVVDGAKLGGILIELRAEAGGPAHVVIGIGCNVALGEGVIAQIATTGTQATDLAQLGVDPCDRNQLVAAVLTECVSGLRQFERAGFAGFSEEWRAADALAGKSVLVSADHGSVNGHARGIDIDGALCVQTRDGLQRFLTGDVSVRATSA